MSAVNTAEQRSGRGSNGQFTAGNSGRPAGARNRATLIAERLLDGQAEAITQAAIDGALAKEPTALRLCLERILAPRWDRPVTLPEPIPSSPVEAIDVVIAAVATGRITPEAAGRLVGIFNVRAQLAEIHLLMERIARLEALLAGRSGVVIDESELTP